MNIRLGGVGDFERERDLRRLDDLERDEDLDLELEELRRLLLRLRELLRVLLLRVLLRLLRDE